MSLTGSRVTDTDICKPFTENIFQLFFLYYEQLKHNSINVGERLLIKYLKSLKYNEVQMRCVYVMTGF